jgi:tetratricopeptide (TPR) repeat protein
MGKYLKALDQIQRAWKRRDEVILSSSVSGTKVRTKKELLLAARMSFSLGQYNDAEEYIDSILEQWPDSPEGLIAHTEKIKILNELNKFSELKEFLLEHPETPEKDIDYYTMIARCHWELGEYADSAEAWSMAFGMNSENGVYAVNAANALDIAGKKEEALSLFLAAGKIFIKQGNNEEIAAMIPKLSNLGSENWEARVLIGKWAYSVNDYARCLVEFAASEKLKKDLRPRPKGDPAVYYLWGLASNIMGKNKNAVRLLERAVKLAPDYGLFRFKLAEIKITGGNYDRDVIKELKHALDFIDDGMKAEMANRAGNLLLNAGDAKNAKHFLNIAAAGNPPEEQKESSDAGD